MCTLGNGDYTDDVSCDQYYWQQDALMPETGTGEVGADPLEGGGDTNRINISNFTTTGQKAVGVQNSLRWIDAWLSQGNDSDCNGWLASNSSVINTILGQTSANGTMYVGVGNFSDPSVAAIAGVTGTNLPDGSAALTVNLDGAYFSSNYSVGGTNFAYQGGSSQAEVLILLHELAHLTGAADFQSGDDSVAQTKANNDLVMEHCSKTIQGLGGN